MSKPTSDCRATERKHPWPMVRLGDVCDEIKNRIQSSKVAVGEYVTTDNMVKDRGGIVQAEYVPSDVGLVEYRKGDVLIANIRPYLKKIWLADHDGGCSSDVVVFRTNTDGLSSEYLYSVLSQDAYFEYVMQKPRGTKMPRGDRDWMKEFRFPLPPLSEQKEIVARLERELAAVEKMKKGFEALAETAKAEFKAELKEVFEEIKRGGAETRRLGEVCELIKDGEHKTPRRVESYCGYYLLSARNVKDDNLALEDVDYVDKEEFDRIAKRCRPIAGDVLISCSGSVGRVCVADEAAYVMVRSAAMVRASRFDSRFLMFMLQSDWLQKQIAKLQRQAAQANLFLGAIAELNVYVPPLAAQREVVTRLDFVKARAEKLEAKAREGVAVCETMRKAILKEAFE